MGGSEFDQFPVLASLFAGAVCAAAPRCLRASTSANRITAGFQQARQSRSENLRIPWARLRFPIHNASAG